MKSNRQQKTKSAELWNQTKFCAQLEIAKIDIPAKFLKTIKEGGKLENMKHIYECDLINN